MAAAIGAGLPTTEPIGCMVVDIGGGTSEVAVIALGGIVVSQSVRCAGDEFDAAIINFIKKRYNLLIGERTAESIKMQIGSAYPVDRDEIMQIKGRNLMSGLPENVNISSKEVREALSEPFPCIVDADKCTLEQTPPELARTSRPRYYPDRRRSTAPRTGSADPPRKPACLCLSQNILWTAWQRAREKFSKIWTNTAMPFRTIPEDLSNRLTKEADSYGRLFPQQKISASFSASLPC